MQDNKGLLKDGLLAILGASTVLLGAKYYAYRRKQKLKNSIRKLQIKEMASGMKQSEMSFGETKLFPTKQQIFKICLTGGPCGGKTSGLAYLADKFRERGYAVYVVPEAATLMSLGGGMLNMAGYAEETISQFQQNLLRLQMNLESCFMTIASLDPQNTKTIILCDRGLMDGAAYMSRDSWTQMLDEMELNELDIRDKRYQCVVHLVTAADGAERHYQQDNSARFEQTLEQAIQQDRRTQAAWVGHPNFKKIDNYSVKSIQEKLEYLFQYVAKTVGISVDLEQKKRVFIVNFNDQKIKINCQVLRIQITYLKDTNADFYSKVKRSTINGNDLYTLKQKTIERINGIINKKQVTEQITRNRYFQFLDDKDPKRATITKTRTCFVYNGQYMFVDVHDNLFQQLSILTVKDFDPSVEVQFPPFLNITQVIKNNEAYKARVLSGQFQEYVNDEENQIHFLNLAEVLRRFLFSTTKEEYLKDVQTRRQEYEKMRSQSLKEAQSQELREKRDYEVNYGRVDYARVMIENTVFEASEFKHPDELWNFVAQLKVRLTEDSLLKCIRAMINFSEGLTEEDLLRVEYHELLHVITTNLRVISHNDSLVLLAQFLDLFCVESDHPIWQQFEVTVLNKLNTLALDQLTHIYSHLANQREGSDYFWDHSENYALGLLKDSLPQCIQILISYWKVSRGTKPFIQKLISIIIKQFPQSQLNSNQLIQIMTVLTQIANDPNVPTQNSDFQALFKTIEEQLQTQTLTLEQVCMTAQAFGFDFGSQQFFEKLESHLEINTYSLQQLKEVIKGFLLTYRGSPKIIKELMTRVQALKHEFTISELSSIVKAVYITENQTQDFLMDIERKGILLILSVITRLKDAKNVTKEEIFDIAQSYLLTRIGSRELYKLLEIIINYRFDELRQDAVLLGRLHDLYQKSALCDPTLIARMATFL